MRHACVTGFNVGITQGSAWDGLLQRVLFEHKAPCFFTDTMHARFTWVQQRINLKQGSDASVIDINPFRAPVHQYSASDNMPSYSNGFIFTIKTYAISERDGSSRAA